MSYASALRSHSAFTHSTLPVMLQLCNIFEKVLFTRSLIGNLPVKTVCLKLMLVNAWNIVNIWNQDFCHGNQVNVNFQYDTESGLPGWDVVSKTRWGFCGWGIWGCLLATELQELVDYDLTAVHIPMQQGQQLWQHWREEKNALTSQQNMWEVLQCFFV